ncbi:MAG: hypothetical protein KKD39_03965 [Candidatus Altiarchaeota archaeon]|nr:hypothetical protein [Candidatus Altiarchaeota archaeon]
MAKDLDVVDIKEVLIKGWRKILFTTLIFTLSILIISLIVPRTYETKAVIQLGSIYNKGVYDTFEAKNIFLSTEIIQPIITKYYEGDDADYQNFVDEKIDVELVSESYGYQQTGLVPFLRITLRADDTDKSKEMIDEMVNAFIEKGNKEIKNEEDAFTREYLQYKDKYIQEKDAALKVAEEDYNNTIETTNVQYDIGVKKTQEEMLERELRIKNLEADLEKMTSEVERVDMVSSDPSYIGRVALLKTLLEDSKSRLNQEQNLLIGLKSSLGNMERGYKKVISTAEIKYAREKKSALSTYEKYMLDNEVKYEKNKNSIKKFLVSIDAQKPKTYKYPNIALNIVISVFTGLFLGSIWALIAQEKKRKPR